VNEALDFKTATIMRILSLSDSDAAAKNAVVAASVNHIGVEGAGRRFSIVVVLRCSAAVIRDIYLSIVRGERLELQD
jgi:hypothetical protein